MDPVVEQDPRRAVARLAVAVMAADGRVTSPEVAALERLDHLGLGSLGPLIEEEFERATREPVDIRPACVALAGASREAAHTLLAALAAIATSDRVLAGRERDTYEAIARLLGVPERESAHILATAAVVPAQESALAEPTRRRRIAVEGPAETLGSSAAEATRSAVRAAPDADPVLANARRLLGVDAAATREDIDAAYLAQVSRFNPAGVVAMGPEFVALAVHRLADATAAWEVLAGAAGTLGGPA